MRVPQRQPSQGQVPRSVSVSPIREAATPEAQPGQQVTVTKLKDFRKLNAGVKPLEPKLQETVLKKAYPAMFGQQADGQGQEPEQVVDGTQQVVEDLAVDAAQEALRIYDEKFAEFEADPLRIISVMRDTAGMGVIEYASETNPDVLVTHAVKLAAILLAVAAQCEALRELPA